MINCPKCGFRQPKDEFCAQCGVHIDSFQPETPPLGRRLAKNLRNWGSLLVLVAILAGLLGYRHWMNQKPQNEADLRLTQAIPNAPYRDPASSGTRAEAASFENFAASDHAQPANESSLSQSVQEKSSPVDAASEKPKSPPSQIRFQFAMDRAGDLLDLLDGVSIAEQGEWNGWSFGLVKQLDQFARQSSIFEWMPALPGSYPLEQQRRLDLELPTLQESLSLQFDVVFLSMDAEQGILISLQHLPSGEGDDTDSGPQSDPIDFWIPPQSYGYVAGLLPKAAEGESSPQEENLAFMVLFQPVYSGE